MKHKKILACFLAFSFLLTGCSTKDQSQSLSMTGTYFDTVVKIEVWGADSKIMDGCKDICEKYEQLLSPTIDSSEISQINQAQGASVSVSKETADLIELGKYYGDLSGGKFDITIASASDLWNFHDNNRARVEICALMRWLGNRGKMRLISLSLLSRLANG